MPNEIKFHKNVHLPGDLECRCLTILVQTDGKYRLTEHAREKAEERKIALPDRIPFTECTIVEVTVIDGEIDRFLVRFPYGDGRNDLCMSYGRGGYIPTLYLNAHWDQHYTLDAYAYASGE